MLKKLILLTALATLAACSAKSSAVSSNLPYQGYKTELQDYEKAMEQNKPSASLWSPTGGMLYVDYKARVIGDLVTVSIVEESSANNSNNTSTSKGSAYSAGIEDLFGMPTNLGMSNFLNAGNAFSPTLAASSDSSFSGSGAKTRSDTMQATIAARVVDVLPSGNLVIEGQREIIVDQEKQTLSIRGVVRPKDIDSTNTVLSTNIADAQINYTGDGIISDANRKGWMAQFLDWIWPF